MKKNNLEIIKKVAEDRKARKPDIPYDPFNLYSAVTNKTCIHIGDYETTCEETAIQRASLK